MKTPPHYPITINLRGDITAFHLRQKRTTSSSSSSEKGDSGYDDDDDDDDCHGNSSFKSFKVSLWICLPFRVPP